ncbi:MAG TPA: hypothetical protein DEB32_10800 [Stenotrophomonas sp.]|uniref:hypothetical protein n=1 Tax=Stenotrophomonas sp. TaxID=69392 RepID=UPI000E9D9308|nr:hypothetical protein [Stenotrophomonas sp.]HBS63183.1 hypothetical protein [Stenotrophomonas sp.]
MDVTLYPCHIKKLARGGHARAAKFAHVVEGRRYTTRQIASRLDVSMGCALERAKRGPFPLTWASLQQSRLVKS